MARPNFGSGGLLVVAMTAASVLVACTGGGAAAPTSPGAPSADTGPAATPAAISSEPAITPASATASAAGVATPEASALETLTPTASPTTPAASIDAGASLKSLVPAEIAGKSLTIEPALDGGQSFLGLWNDEKMARKLLDSLGASPKDVEIVYGYGEVEAPKQLYVTAYRIPRVDGTALRDGMISNYQKVLGWDATPATLGGKDVVAVHQSGSSPESGQIFYSVGNNVFMVSANPTDWAIEALGKLP